MTYYLTTKYERVEFLHLGNTLSKVARSFTIPADTYLRHLFVELKVVGDYLGYDNSTIAWGVYSDHANLDTPSSTLLSGGTLDVSEAGGLKLGDTFVVPLIFAQPFELQANITYWLVLSIPTGSTLPLRRSVKWATPSPHTGYQDASTVVVYSPTTAAWVKESGLSAAPVLIPTDAQAGVNWHVLLDEYGYMTPDYLESFRIRVAQGGFASMRGGQSAHSQLRFPYSSISQTDWTAGGGQLHLSDGNLNAFLFGAGMDTLVDGQMSIGPRVNETGAPDTTTGMSYENDAIVLLGAPQYKTWAANDVGYGTHLYQKITPSTNIALTSLAIRGAALTKSQPIIAVVIKSDNAGAPDATLSSGSTLLGFTADASWQTVTMSALNMVGGTDYWLCLSFGGIKEENALYFNAGMAAATGVAEAKWQSPAQTLHAAGCRIFFRLNGKVIIDLDDTVTSFAQGTVGGSFGFFCAAGDYIYKWVEADKNWVVVHQPSAGNNITHLLVYADKLYIGLGYVVGARTWDGTSGAAIGTPAKLFSIQRGFLWANTVANGIKYSSNGTTWSAALYCGTADYEINAMTDYLGKMLVGKEEGIWEIDEQNNKSRSYFNFREVANETNCTSMVTYSGMLMLPVQHDIWRWSGATYKSVAPTAQLSGMAKSWPTKVARMAASSQWLFASAEPLDSNGYGGLLAYNGMGWHYMCKGQTKGQKYESIYITSDVHGAVPEMRVWWGEGKRVCYATFPESTAGRFDWDNAEFQDTGVLATSWVDGGFHDALKLWNRLTISADIPTTGRVRVRVAKNGLDWADNSNLLDLGTFEYGDEDVSGTGRYTLRFPDGFLASSIQLVFVLETSDKTASPRVTSYNLEALVRQIPAYVYSFRVLLADNVRKMDNTIETTRTGENMLDELFALNAKEQPILLSIPGRGVRGMISHLEVATEKFKSDGSLREVWERYANVSVTELG